MTRFLSVLLLLTVLYCLLYCAQVEVLAAASAIKCPNDKIPLKIGASEVCIPKNYTVTEEN